MNVTVLGDSACISLPTSVTWQEKLGSVKPWCCDRDRGVSQSRTLTGILFQIPSYILRSTSVPYCLPILNRSPSPACGCALRSNGFPSLASFIQAPHQWDVFPSPRATCRHANDPVGSERHTHEFSYSLLACAERPFACFSRVSSRGQQTKPSSRGEQWSCFCNSVSFVACNVQWGRTAGH